MTKQPTDDEVYKLAKLLYDEDKTVKMPEFDQCGRYSNNYINQAAEMLGWKWLDQEAVLNRMHGTLLAVKVFLSNEQSRYTKEFVLELIEERFKEYDILYMIVKSKETK